MPIWTFGGVTFDPLKRVIWRLGVPVEIRKKTADLLDLFLRSGGEAVSKDKIIEMVWDNRAVSENTLAQSVSELRRALGDDARQPRFIRTLHGTGFCWVGPAAVLEDKAISRSPVFRLFGREAGRLEAALVVTAAAAAVIAISLLSIQSGVFQSDFDRALSAEASGQSDLAIRYLEAARITEPDNPEVATRLAQLYYETGDYDGVIGIAELAERPGMQEAYPGQSALIFIMAGHVAYDRGELAYAQQLYTHARDLSEHASLAVAQIIASHQLSTIAADFGQLQQYIALRTTASDSLLAASDQSALAQSLLSSGTSLHHGFDYSWGAPRLQRALAEFIELGDARGEARVRVALGSDPTGDAEQRRQNLERARDMYAQLGNVRGEVRALIGLADLEISAMNGAAAMEHVARARRHIRSMGAARIDAGLIYRTGLAILSEPDGGSYDASELDGAIEQFDLAIAAYRDLGVVLDGLAPRFHRAIAYLAQGHFEVAMREFMELETHYEALGFMPGLTGARLGQAAVLFALDRPEEGHERIRDLTGSMPALRPVGEALERAYESGEIAPFSSGFFEIVIQAEQQIAGMSAQSE